MERMERRMKKMILAGIGAAALAREESNGLIHDSVSYTHLTLPTNILV